MNTAEYIRHREEIAGLLDPRCYSIDWLDDEVANGRVVPFGNDGAVILVEIKEYPAGAKEVHGMVAAGEMVAILSLIDRAETWGREQGCAFASISSREGWARLLATRGYAPFQLTIRKELG